MTLPLITEPDGHEKVRDQIALVLATEFAAQFALSGNDPRYDVDIYLERFNPWDRATSTDTIKPLINVWYESSIFEKQGSTVRAQRSDGSFNIDVYGFGYSQDDGGTGQIVGDKFAALQSQDVAGIARRILMSSQYTYLGSARKENQFVFGRWVDSMTAFQPQLETRPGIHVSAVRLVLGVHYKVDSPQATGDIIEITNTKIFRDEDGKLIIDMTTDNS